MENINLSGGHTNAAEFCQLLLGFPSFIEVGEYYDNQVTVVDEVSNIIQI